MLKKYKAYLNIILKRLVRALTAVVAVIVIVAVIVTGTMSVQKEDFTDISDISSEGDLLESFLNNGEMEFAGKDLLMEKENRMSGDSTALENGSESDHVIGLEAGNQYEDASIMLFSLPDFGNIVYSSEVEPSDYAVSEKNELYYEAVQKNYRQVMENGWQDGDVYQDEVLKLENGLSVTEKAKKVDSALDNEMQINLIEEKRIEQEKQAEAEKMKEEAMLKGQAEAAERKAEKERKEAEATEKAAREAEEAAQKAAKEKEESAKNRKKKTKGLSRMEEDPDAEYEHSDELVYKYNKKMDIEVTDEEYEVLCRIVEAEAGDQDVYGRILVANVILNRVRYKKEFANNIIDVVFAPNQFAPTRDGSYYRVTVDDLTKEAVNRATSGEDYSQGALYFFMRSGTTAAKASWFDTLHFLFKYGCHEFFK